MTATSNNSVVPACLHKRTQTVAKDSDSRYEECLDCGAILEADELQANELQANELRASELQAHELPANGLRANAALPHAPTFHESLSDA